MLPTFRVREAQPIPVDSIGDAPSQLLQVLSRRAYVVVAVILMGTFLSFASGLDNPPVAEDYSNRWEDIRGNGAGQLRPAFGLAVVASSWIVGTPYDAPAPHHLFLLFTHMASAILVFLIARQLTSSPLAGIAATFVFALYPRHHEPVLWPAAGMHPMMTVFGLASFLCYLQARQSRSRNWLIASIGCFAVSILSSEVGMVVIGLILAHEVFFHPPERATGYLRYGRRLARTALPYVAIAICYLAILILMRGGPLSVVETSNSTSEYHMTLSPTKLKDLGGYLSYSLFMYVPLRTIDESIVKLGLLLMTGITFGVGFLFGSRVIRFGLCWVVLAVVPYAILVPFGNADRYFYLASVGIALVAAGIAVSVVRVAGGLDQRYRYGIGLVAVALMMSYFVASTIWINDKSREWEQAGLMTEDILDKVQAEHPRVSAGTTFYFVDLPQRHGHAQVLHWGMHRMLAERYQVDNLDVYSTTDPEVISTVRAASSACCQVADTYVYLYGDGELEDISARFGSPEVRRVLLVLEPTP